MRTAVVTGASSGIGEACVRRLARQGWDVVLIARREERLSQIAREVGGRVIVADVVNLEEQDLAEVSSCSALVNCAGGALGVDAVQDADPQDWLKMYEVNVLGTLRVTQILLQRLIDTQGCIVNITSTAAIGGYEGGGGYCAAKSAARALTQSLRLELVGVPVRVTEVLPGMVHTQEFALNRFGGDTQRAAAVYEGVDRPLTAEDVAQVVSSVIDLPAHVNVDEIVVRPVAQRSQHKLFRGSIGWHDEGPASSNPPRTNRCVQ